MKATDLELISAETKTFYHLNLREKDEIILLYSATKSGEECAKILKLFFTELGQEDVTIKQIPEVNYEIDVNGSILEKMANLLAELIKNAKGNVTLAATGGFKAQSMIMALSGNIYQVPVCYIHEQYKSLIYLPFYRLMVKLVMVITKQNYLILQGIEKIFLIFKKGQNITAPKHGKKLKKFSQKYLG